MTTHETHPDRPDHHEPDHRDLDRPDRRPPHRLLDARSVDDVLAAVPVLMGFEPTDSVVMLTFGGPHGFHARTDLPTGGGPGEVDDLVRLLLEPCLEHRVPAVLFVLYTADPPCGRRAGRALDRAFGSAGIEVRAVLRTDGERWFVPVGPGGGAPEHGVPYDVSAHPFRLQAVVDGQVTHASREALADTLRPDVAAVARTQAALPGAVDLDATALAACCTGRVRAGGLFEDAELAAVALALRDDDLRGAAWAGLRRDHALDQVRLWTDALVRTPDGLVPGVAAVLGLAAWLAGQGALAWCAVDRATEAEPAHPLAEIVAGLLGDAVPPSTWDPERLAGVP